MKVLRRMRRGYTAEAYVALAERARALVPGVALSSDFIAGFCGETEADHQATLDLVRHVGYDQVGRAARRGWKGPRWRCGLRPGGMGRTRDEPRGGGAATPALLWIEALVGNSLERLCRYARTRAASFILHSKCASRSCVAHSPPPRRGAGSTRPTSTPTRCGTAPTRPTPWRTTCRTTSR